MWIHCWWILCPAEDSHEISSLIFSEKKVFMNVICCSGVEESKAWSFMWILCPAEDSHEISSLIFSEKKIEKVFMNVVCCSRDGHFKD